MLIAHPHVSAANAQQVTDDGYRILFTAPGRSYAAFEKAREILG